MLDAVRYRYERQSDAHDKAMKKSQGKYTQEISVEDLLRGQAGGDLNLEIHKQSST